MPAISIVNLLTTDHPTLDFEGEWYQAFDKPEHTGVWFIWGNSANGKTGFTLQLCKEVYRAMRLRYRAARGAYVSFEEGRSKTVKDAFERQGMATIKKGLKLIYDESIEQISERLVKEKNLRFIVLDSFQYTKLNFQQYLQFKEKHKDKLIIFTSQADGKKPMGRSAVSVQYDASLKIWVEGHKAFSKGRYIGPNGGTYTIWKEGAALYHGQN